MTISFDQAARIITVTDATVVAQDLANAIRDEEASLRGVAYDEIALIGGKTALAPGSSTGITIELINGWRVSMVGAGTRTITGGNLVGGLGGDPIAGDQVRNILSAAAVRVQGAGASISDIEAALTAVLSAGGGTGGGATAAQIQAAVAAELDARGYTGPRAENLDNLDAPISGVQAGGGAVAAGPISLFTDPHAQEALLSTDTLIVEGIGPLRRGDSWDIDGVVAAGGDLKTPIDVTGDTITLTLKRSHRDADPILDVDAAVIDGPAGRISWAVTAAQSDVIADGEYVAQVRRYPAGGGVKTLWFGRVRIQPDL